MIESARKAAACHMNRAGRAARVLSIEVRSGVARASATSMRGGLFDAALACSLATHESFLTEEPDREKLMDRLHAYCYFLEALLAVADREAFARRCVRNRSRGRCLLREIAPRV